MIRTVLRRFLFLTLALLPATAFVACDEQDHAPGIAAEATGKADAGAPDGSPATNLAIDATSADTSEDATAAALGGSSRGRLLVADNDPENPRVLVVDLDDGAVVARFPTLGTARAYASEPGSGYAHAVQNVPGLVEIFASGISAGPDGGLVKRTPFPLETRFNGPRPVHWVSHDHWVVSFNDGDGSFDYLLENTLGTTRTLMRRATTGIAHHGVALIAHGNVIASHAVADPIDATKTVRTGVTVRLLANPDSVVETIPGCPGLHGEAASETVVAFGCADGILLGERKDGKFAFRKLVQPDARGIGTVRTKDGLPRLIGNLRDVSKGYDVGFVVVAYLEAAPAWTPVDLGARTLAFLLEPVGTRLVVLGGDGALRLHDPLTGTPVGTPLPVIAPYTTGSVPGLALGAGVAFVLDPRTGSVIEIDLVAWKTGRTFGVGGQPTSAAAFGYLPAAGAQ